MQLIYAQGVAKWINIGYKLTKVVDSGDEGEGSWGWGMNSTYYDGFGEMGTHSSKAVFLGCKNWTDQNGVLHAVKTSGHGQWETDDRHVMMPVPDEYGWTIHRYMRYQPPTIKVDGLVMNEPYPLNASDHVDPDAIEGTADEFITSTINTDMGVTIHQKVWGFSNPNHDNYNIVEWVLENTGNTDIDDEIELPNQTITDLHLLRQIRVNEDPRGWVTSYGAEAGQDMWVIYRYPTRSEGSEWDDFGDIQEETGYIRSPMYSGETIIFASAAVNDLVNNANDQPSMTGFQDCDWPPVTRHSWNQTEGQISDMWTLMTQGWKALSGDPEVVGGKPGHHSVPMDERGMEYPFDAPWFGYTATGFWGVGPYTLGPGDKVKIVWAEVEGSIDAVPAWDIGQGWLDGELDPPEGFDFNAGIDNLPPPLKQYPELYADDSHASEKINWAKDCWVATGKDSIFATAKAANWAYNHGLNVPQAPPAPSLSITSLSDKILVEWGEESETASDFAGYRVYRSTGSWFPTVPEDQYTLIGGWNMIFECGPGTSTPLTHEFEDKTVQRGVANFYYVTAFDDGTHNGADFDGVQRSLESSMFANMTRKGAYLTREAAAGLDSIKIVPNPFNISATDLQFPGETNKIMFFNLPNECTIRIFTESGDLIKTIEHFGSGDESWGNIPEEHMTTDSDQLVVSGVYIAHFKTPDGQSAIKKFVIIR